MTRCRDVGADRAGRPTVFCFGSNRRGIHGAGAALYARRHHGAVLGVGEGRTGDSYAIPTKATPYSTLALDEVAAHVETFKAYARKHPDLDFQVTAIGTGRAGFTPEQIGPLFADAPANCKLCPEFAGYRSQVGAGRMAASILP